MTSRRKVLSLQVHIFLGLLNLLKVVYQLIKGVKKNSLLIFCSARIAASVYPICKICVPTPHN